MTEIASGSFPRSPQFGTGIWLFFRFVDRYATDGYDDPVGTLEAIERVGRVEGLVALDECALKVSERSEM